MVTTLTRRLALASVITIVVLATADARPIEAPDEIVEDTASSADEPAFNLLGFRFAIGPVPFEGVIHMTKAVGISVEHPVFRKTRVVAAYDWLWLSRIDPRMDTTTLVRPEGYASGHHASLGLRRELAAKRAGGKLRMFVDGELAGGVALINDSLRGVEVVGDVAGGLRFGYDVYTSDDSPSRMFEVAFQLHAIAVRDGLGMMFGLGMAWGN